MKHLDEIGVTYWEHFKFAIRIGFIMILTGIFTIIHAIFPNFLTTITSDVVKKLHALLNEKDDDNTTN